MGNFLLDIIDPKLIRRVESITYGKQWGILLLDLKGPKLIRRVGSVR